MTTFLLAAGLIALAEIGDKTQLLSLFLAARYRRPVPILIGILIATLVNHGLASVLGSQVGALFTPDQLRWGVGGLFVLMGAWVLIPDRLDEDPETSPRFGVLGTTLVLFFLAEMGDKTQIATVGLAAQQGQWFAVTCGTTLGMLLANAPVVLLGDRLARRLPLKTIRTMAALSFILLGLGVLMGAAAFSR
ncbi:MAG: TMEM165/GDT1 family protein [Candidatus Macondimonas sp.]